MSIETKVFIWSATRKTNEDQMPIQVQMRNPRKSTPAFSGHQRITRDCVSGRTSVYQKVSLDFAGLSHPRRSFHHNHPAIFSFIHCLVRSQWPLVMEYHAVPPEERARDEKGNLLPWGYVYKE